MFLCARCIEIHYYYIVIGVGVGGPLYCCSGRMRRNVYVLVAILARSEDGVERARSGGGETVFVIGADCRFSFHPCLKIVAHVSYSFQRNSLIVLILFGANYFSPIKRHCIGSNKQWRFFLNIVNRSKKFFPAIDYGIVLLASGCYMKFAGQFVHCFKSIADCRWGKRLVRIDMFQPVAAVQRLFCQTLHRT